MVALPPAGAMRSTDPTRNPLYRPYQPFGSALELFYAKDDEVLMSGPAGTGKSRACLEKMNFCASKYAGMRGLIVRKTRESLTQSAMVTLERFVLPQNGSVKFRTAEQEYRYTNGSVIVVGGMDKASKVLSTEYDLIYFMQAEEAVEEDWEVLVTRNRFGIMPYNQMIADCNPANPRHFLKLRCDAGVTRYIYSRHEDNPRLYDHAHKKWTPNGVSYIQKLDKLTGVRKKRLRDGMWVAAEGMIYENEWKYDIHVINHMKVPKDWTRIWSVDFGFNHPFVWQCWAINEDMEMFLIAEIYHTKLLVEDACDLIKIWMGQEDEPEPAAVVCDHDAEGRATMERHLEITTIPANKSVLEGIEGVKSMMAIKENGRPSIFFMRDTVMEVDYDLQEVGKPIDTISEIDGYEWDDAKKKEQPKKEYDDGMDATRYAVMHVIGEFGGWSSGMAH